MPGQHQFEHLPLVRREDGPARYTRPRFVETQLTKDNRSNRGAHSGKLGGQVSTITNNWKTQRDARDAAGLPKIDAGIPLLLQIDPVLDIDDLRHYFGFEIISEQDDGFVIVASEDESLAYFQQKLNDFIGSIEGSAGIAKIHELWQDLTQEERLQRKLDAFLQFNERNILKHAGKVSHQLAEDHAHAEFAKFDAERLRLTAAQPTSDFDQVVDEVKRLEQAPPPAPQPKQKPGRKKKGDGK